MRTVCDCPTSGFVDVGPGPGRPPVDGPGPGPGPGLGVVAPGLPGGCGPGFAGAPGFRRPRGSKSSALACVAESPTRSPREIDAARRRRRTLESYTFERLISLGRARTIERRQAAEL